MDVFTIADDVEIIAAGGSAKILNPVTMEFLDNDVVADTKVELLAGTQLMLVGVFETTDTWLLVVSEAGNFHSSEDTFGLVVRRKTWEKIERLAVESEVGEAPAEEPEIDDVDMMDDFEDYPTEEVPRR
jgi:hypothetical protein